MAIEWLFRKYPHLRQWAFPRFFSRFNLTRHVLIPTAVIAASALIYAGFANKLRASDWAAWVQAVGSISAIFAAWRLGANQVAAQNRLAKRMHHYQHMQRVKGILPIANKAKDLVTDLADRPTKDYLRNEYSESAFARCITALNAVHLTELGSYSLIEGYLDLQEGLEKAARIVKLQSQSAVFSEFSDHHTQQILAAKDMVERGVVTLFESQILLQRQYQAMPI